MAKARIVPQVGEAAVLLSLENQGDRAALATAVRFLLQVLADATPGNTVEVRVPPFGAVQCVEGPVHTRGTPPNVVETDPVTWLRLATGALVWDDARASGTVSASGQRADLRPYLPLGWRRTASGVGENEDHDRREP